MRNIFIYIFVIVLASMFHPPSVLSQRITHTVSKPPIDFEDIDAYIDVEDPDISRDGRYNSYIINNLPLRGHTLIVQSSDGAWRDSLVGKDAGFFSGDSRQYVYLNQDTLQFLDLGTGTLHGVPGVQSCSPVPGTANAWMIYRKDQYWVLSNPAKGIEKRLQGVAGYWTSPDGRHMLLQQDSGENQAAHITLYLIDLSSGLSRPIWTFYGSDRKELSIEMPCFNPQGDKLAFVVSRMKSDTASFSTINKNYDDIWYCRLDQDTVDQVVRMSGKDIFRSKDFNLRNIDFSGNGKYLFLYLSPVTPSTKANPDVTPVDIWSYKDSSVNSLLRPTPRTEIAIKGIDLESGIAIQLADVDEDFLGGDHIIHNDYAIVIDKAAITDSWWPSYSLKRSWLVSLKDGSRRFLKSANDIGSYDISPGGKYCICYDTKNDVYESHELATGRSAIISRSVTESLGFPYHQSIYNMQKQPFGILGWLRDDHGVFVYDRWGDIWLLFLDGKTKPVSVTAGYCKHNNLHLHPIDESKGVFDNDEKLMMVAYDTASKFNGFYCISLQGRSVPKKLVMGPWTFYHTGREFVDELDPGMKPLKAGDSALWIVKRQSDEQAPNYFLTKDFTHFQPMSEIGGEHSYNWLYAELVTWKLPDGTFSQGVLYKPENFDPAKKYPLLIHYYEQFSNRMYEYTRPDLTTARINIPWFVSREYIVFTPDIHYQVGRPGASAAQSVCSAAEYLAKKPYIDPHRIGIQGHSFAGFETNYIITHSHIFSAAMEASGTSNMVGAYLSSPALIPHNKMESVESGQGRLGGTLWDFPAAYLENSPIMQANKVSTPLLIMHNKNDESVAWEQGVEMFMALRRLHKRVWFLQYDAGSHTLHGQAAKDYTIRMTEYFDFYLKGSPPPIWMTQPVPAFMKGVEDFYDLDKSGAIP